MTCLFWWERGLGSGERGFLTHKERVIMSICNLHGFTPPGVHGVPMKGVFENVSVLVPVC